jgi:hypothetical protein
VLPLTATTVAVKLHFFPSEEYTVARPNSGDNTPPLVPHLWHPPLSEYAGEQGVPILSLSPGERDLAHGWVTGAEALKRILFIILSGARLADACFLFYITVVIKDKIYKFDLHGKLLT